MTKTKRFITSFLTVVMLLVLMLPIKAFAKAPLDEIQSYDLTVDMRNDGTMDIRYHIEWKVLDDSSEGPLSWVKIGIPNKHVDEIEGLSSNIKKIKYYPESGKTYVRVDLDREYKANEIVTFDFSIHQSHMYVIDKDDHLLRYSFTPGWFDECEVKKVTIRWNSFNVIKNNATEEKDGYLLWSASLSFGEKINASVSYNLDAFNTNESEQYVENEGTGEGIPGWVIVIIIIIVIFVIILIVLALSGDDYDGHSGLGGRSGYRHTTYVHHSSCVSHCACVSSCACACACAGGGRAGCSKKDFYGTKLQSDTLIEVLEEEI